MFIFGSNGGGFSKGAAEPTFKISLSLLNDLKVSKLSNFFVLQNKLKGDYFKA